VILFPHFFLEKRDSNEKNRYSKACRDTMMFRRAVVVVVT
jgi:hypothetical protein